MFLMNESMNGSLTHSFHDIDDLMRIYQRHADVFFILMKECYRDKQ